MKNFKLEIVGILLLVCVAAIAGTCGGEGGSSSGGHQKTPKGAVVTGAVLSAADLQKVDADLDQLERVLAGRGYGFGGHKSYVIEVLPDDAACPRYSFAVTGECDPPNCYDGSEYDTDPRPRHFRICVVGRYIPETDRIQVTLAGIRETAIVRYEGEHKELRRENPTLYRQTLTHGQGQGHPILGD